LVLAIIGTMSIPSPRWLETIDAHQFGQSRTGAVYVVCGKRAALIESGTAASAPRLLSRLRGVSLAYVFVTHIHLDHAGGAGVLAADHPEATVVVHSRGARHLTDPRRLIDGARAASPNLFDLYGEPLPIPEDRVLIAEDGDRFDLGDGIVLEAVESPGHAPHHLCFFERSERILFCGDAVGNHGVPVDTPLTVPPRFDLEAGLATLRRLRALEPRRLGFTHFGLAASAASILSDYEAQLIAWFDRLRAMRESMSPEEVVSDILAKPRYADMSPVDRMAVEMCVRGGLLSLEDDA
jgi:glyoxylase-like metal-dependent hydrolase (beta-lactamase superfamily II)